MFSILSPIWKFFKLIVNFFSKVDEIKEISHLTNKAIDELDDLPAAIVSMNISQIAKEVIEAIDATGELGIALMHSKDNAIIQISDLAKKAIDELDDLPAAITSMDIEQIATETIEAVNATGKLGIAVVNMVDEL